MISGLFIKDLLVSERSDGLNNIFQFANVSRPPILIKLLSDLVGKRLILPAIAGRIFPQEVVAQQINVVPAFP